MQRLGAEPYMDAARRNDILAQIASARAKERRVLEVLQSLPAWAERPFQKDQENFDANLRTYQAAQPIVRNIESRLMMTPGPIWKALTPDEQTALSNWSKSIDQLYAYVNTYFPSETQQYIAQAALLVIAIGAFVAPLFLDEPEKGLTLPFGLEPPGFPKRTPRPRAPIAPPQTAAPVFTPTSYSRIPRAVGPSTPLRVQPEIMRPAAPTLTPWRKTEPAATPGAPGYRTFTRPLDIPVSRVQTPSEAAATMTRPP